MIDAGSRLSKSRHVPNRMGPSFVAGLQKLVLTFS
jgi:hypothetical protein